MRRIIGVLGLMILASVAYSGPNPDQCEKDGENINGIPIKQVMTAKRIEATESWLSYFCFWLSSFFSNENVQPQPQPQRYGMNDNHECAENRDVIDLLSYLGTDGYIEFDIDRSLNSERLYGGYQRFYNGFRQTNGFVDEGGSDHDTLLSWYSGRSVIATIAYHRRINERFRPELSMLQLTLRIDRYQNIFEDSSTLTNFLESEIPVSRILDIIRSFDNSYSTSVLFQSLRGPNLIANRGYPIQIEENPYVFSFIGFAMFMAYLFAIHPNLDFQPTSL